jgi:solute:Na+ symporter, SSS family
MSNLLILIYLTGVLVVGLAFSAKRDRSAEEFFYNGRKTGPLVVGSSLVLSNLLRYQILLLPLLAIGWFWVAVLLSIALVLLSYRFTPLPDGGHSSVWTDPRCRWFVNILMLVTYLAVQTTGVLVLADWALGNVVNIDYSTAVLIVIVFAGIYAVVGGFSAMAHAQVFQVAVFAGGLLALALLKGLPDPAGLLSGAMYQGQIGLVSALLGLPIVSLWVWRFDRFSTQQVETSAGGPGRMRGLLIGAGLSAAILSILLLAMGEGFSPLIDPALRGILLVVSFSAFMASFAASFTGLSEFLATEFFRPVKPHASERELVLVGRLATAAVVGISILLIPVARTTGAGALELFLLVQTCLYPPLTAVLTVRLVNPSLPTASIRSSLIAGEGVALLWLLFHLVGPSQGDLVPALAWFAGIDPFLFAFCLFVFTAAVLYATAMVTSDGRKVAGASS